MTEQKPDLPDVSRSSVRLDAREERICRRLVLVGPGPAAFFRDACAIMRGDTSIASSSHIVGHLLREVESAIRAVLITFSEQTGADRTTGSGKHRRQVEQVLKALRIGEDHPVGRAWLRFAEETEEYALHRIAHRDSLAAPRPINEKFRSFWNEACTLLDVVLDRFESSYLALVPKIDSLLAKENPGPSDARTLRNNIPNNLATLGKFFAKLENPKWLAVLRNEGFFARPPEPMVNEEEGTISFPPWPLSRFLIRMAPIEPTLVASIAANLPLTDNMNVHTDLMDVALALPSDLGAEIVPQLTHAVECPHRGFLFTHKLDTLILHLIECTQNCKRALGFIEAVFDIATVDVGSGKAARTSRFPRPKTQIDVHEYERILRKTAKKIGSKCGEAALDLFCDLLVRAISNEEQDGEEADREDWSYIWCRDVSNCSGEHDARCALVDAVLICARCLVEEHQLTIEECVKRLEKRPWKVFDRLGLYLLRLFPDRNFAAERLLKRNAFDDSTLAREYNGLLEKSFGGMKPEDQGTILDWIREGVDREEYSDRAERVFGQRPNANEAEEYSERWRLKHLHPIQAALAGEWRTRYERLVEQFGVPQLYHPGPSVSWGRRSPIEAEQLRSKSDQEILDFLKTWKPGPDIHSGPSRKGLADELEKLVAADAPRFVNFAEGFASLEASYIVGILTGLERATKTSWRAEFWPPILEFCRAACDRKFTTPVIDEDEDAERATQWVRQAVESLISAGLTQTEAQLQIELRKEVWNILMVVSDDPDPTIADETDGESNCDPFTRSLNTVRGKALHAVINYALWIRRNKPVEEAEESFGDMPEVAEVLDRHLDSDSSPSIRSIYGESFVRLFALDKRWAASRVENIFPASPDQAVLRDAAWQPYIVFCRPYNAIFELLRPQYARAIRELDREPAFQVAGNADDKERLAEHLILFYGRGVITLGEEDLISLFFKHAPMNARRHALAFIGRSLG